MDQELQKLIDRVKRLSKELDKRCQRHEKLEPYLEGSCPPPEAIQRAKLTKVYRDLMPVAEAPWGQLIVGSKLDRLEISGLRDATNEAAAKQIWEEAWQPNDMDSESKLAHGAALLDGRCYATVWPGPDGTPDIALDDMTQMIVEFAPGSRRHRVAALRRWKEGDRLYATLYLPDGLYKFQGPEGSASTKGNEWEKREVDGESWPLENPFSPKIPVVEIAINRRLKPGTFPLASGEFEHCLGLIDRINLLTFLGLVVAFWMGFPLRGVVGEKITEVVMKDDNGDPILDKATGKPQTEQKPPIEVVPESVFQFENPEAKLVEYKAADRKNLAIYPELDQLAVITATPRHYFPMENGMSNISADAIRASEGSMHAAVTGHKASLGTGWEEINRLAGQCLKDKAVLSPRAETVWVDAQSRSLAERADAASKLKDVIPAEAIAELALNATQDQIARWAAQGATNPLLAILQQVKSEGPPVGVGAG